MGTQAKFLAKFDSYSTSPAAQCTAQHRNAQLNSARSTTQCTAQPIFNPTSKIIDQPDNSSAQLNQFSIRQAK
jgi:hypothetical protein